MKILAKKALGQHFCINQIVLASMIEAAGNIKNEYILEIGSGTGALSNAILVNKPKELIMIEKDSRCIQLLNKIKILHKNITIINADATNYDFSKNFAEKQPLTVIANLPYNISTAIINHFLKNISIFKKLTLMFQQEVAKRITASPGSKDYSRLSVLVGMLCDVKYITTVSPQSFYPQPKVNSAIVTLTPKNITYTQSEISTINKIAKIVFNQKRKQLRKSLNFIPNIIQHLENIKINPKNRPENLQIEDFYNMAKIPTIKNLILRR
ncbi:Ribosomal RNA small subunit methyltransferase A [Candidatus Xenohaliotis californiensis]|uniref:Ribosomal RNA small subunit methyltransferase A n=1 Tax=Candidatus Xenohaliotis californiensis TaxID=84677 RepID=A0ABM9N823_9RICK|nr:Ribosomal RNA small subunit methyltransferase A [Candidatus Xenohaliotis californiensis]